MQLETVSHEFVLIKIYFTCCNSDSGPKNIELSKLLYEALFDKCNLPSPSNRTLQVQTHLSSMMEKIQCYQRVDLIVASEVHE